MHELDKAIFEVLTGSGGTFADGTQILLLEGLSEAFEKEKPDIEALTDYLPLIAQEMRKTEKERKAFSRELSKGIGKFNSTSGLIVINHALAVLQKSRQTRV